MNLRILHVAPATLHQNGEIGNIHVLRRRAEARGIEVAVVPCDVAADADADVDLVFIGTGPVAAQRRAQPLVVDVAGRLLELAAAGVPFLAIAAGFQLLGRSIRFDGGEELPGAGVLPVTTSLEGARIVGDFVVDSRIGRLVGFENRGARIDIGDASPVGTVVYGQGNAPGAGVEGVWIDSLIGTHLQGPVLANNPDLADWLLARALERGGNTLPAVPDSLATIDAYAAEVRRAIAAHPASE